MLSAFLFIIYTNDLAENSTSGKIIKYADDTVVVGLISNNDENNYRKSIVDVIKWCNDNFLEVNVTKTKEMTIDFRKNKNEKVPILINGKDVEVVSEYKYLGCLISNDLKWESHLHCQIKKANSRMYLVRSLWKLNINSKILVLLYNSIVSSVISYVITTWFNACTDHQKKAIGKFKRRMCKLIRSDYTDSVEIPQLVCETKSLSAVTRIMSDNTHPLHYCFSLLPHGLRLNMIYCRTNRFQSTFVPSAIKLYNTGK